MIGQPIDPKLIDKQDFPFTGLKGGMEEGELLMAGAVPFPSEWRIENRSELKDLYASETKHKPGPTTFAAGCFIKDRRTNVFITVCVWVQRLHTRGKWVERIVLSTCRHWTAIPGRLTVGGTGEAW